MCGIAGIIAADTALVTDHCLRRMASAIQHRGPDAEATWRDATGSAGFAHRRLAIIDRSPGGAQPMHYLGRYTIVYNGEIYNYIELKAALVAKGYGFATDSDTEVVLAAFACYGDGCLEHFDGMFAFAIWDAQLQELFAARDRFGEKPFYFSVTDNRDQFVFGSEMKALWAGGIAKTIDQTMMLNYITLGQVQDATNKSRTFYQGISSLAPAHRLRYNHRKRSLTISRYYTVDRANADIQRTGPVLQQEFLERLGGSVRLRLRSDVAVGTSLSGGLDSSSIVALIRQWQPEKALPTFSAVFPGFDKDESRYVEQMAQRYNLQSRVVVPDADGLLRDFERLCYHQEEPFPSTSIYAQFKVFELAAIHHVTVLLDGQGADEILAGYPKHLHWYLQQLLKQGDYRMLRQELAAIRANNLSINWSWRNYLAAFTPRYAANRLQQRALRMQEQHPDITSAFIAGNISQETQQRPVIRTLGEMLRYSVEQYGLEELLRFADRNSMAHGREVRLPFLDHKLVALCLNAPDSAKLMQGFTKRLLRDSVSDMLPREITWRTDKIGYEPPQASWMTNPRLNDFLYEAKKRLVDSKVLKPGVLDRRHKPLPAHAADNYEWRYLVAASLTA